MAQNTRWHETSLKMWKPSFRKTMCRMEKRKRNWKITFKVILWFIWEKKFKWTNVDISFATRMLCYPINISFENYNVACVLEKKLVFSHLAS